MKIAFLGTHGTGKTTLAHDLVTKLKKQGIDAGFLGEVARKCPFSLNENTTKKSQIWIILNQIIQELEEEEKYEILVCDRSVLDGYCYYANKFKRSIVLENLVKEHLKTYSKLIRVPIRKGLLKKDKIRSTNKKFQQDIDKQFSKFIKLFRLENKIQQMKKEKFSNKEIIKRVLNTI